MYVGRCSAVLLVSTERALWRYDYAFHFTNQSAVDFGIAHVRNSSGSGDVGYVLMLYFANINNLFPSSYSIDKYYCYINYYRQHN